MTSLAHRIGAGARGRRLRPTNRTPTWAAPRSPSTRCSMRWKRPSRPRSRPRSGCGSSWPMRPTTCGLPWPASSPARTHCCGPTSTNWTGPIGKQRLVAIVRQSRHAARLVDDLMVMARLGAGARVQQIVDLVALVRSATRHRHGPPPGCGPQAGYRCAVTIRPGRPGRSAPGPLEPVGQRSERQPGQWPTVRRGHGRPAPGDGHRGGRGIRSACRGERTYFRSVRSIVPGPGRRRHRAWLAYRPGDRPTGRRRCRVHTRRSGFGRPVRV